MSRWTIEKLIKTAADNGQKWVNRKKYLELAKMRLRDLREEINRIERILN